MTFEITWNVHEINLHLMFNCDLNLIDGCASQSRIISCGLIQTLLKQYDRGNDELGIEVEFQTKCNVSRHV